MSKWQELKKYLEDLESINPEGCEKVFNGPSGIITGLEQLLIDRFAEHLFVLTYFEMDDEALKTLIEMLNASFPSCSIRVQHRSSGISTEIYHSPGVPETIHIEEHGLKYIVHTARGQNTGFFADMINGRKAVLDYTASLNDPKILNLFAYTCSFAVAALKGGASSVDNWDMNKNSLAIGRENIRLNGLDEVRSSYFGYDIFKSFSKIRRRGPYDLVVMDPPPMQGKSFSYKKDYPRLIKRVPEIVKPGGAVLFCLNAPDSSGGEFLEMIAENLPGRFESITAVPCPDAYLGRYPERGLKTYLAEAYVKD